MKLQFYLDRGGNGLSAFEEGGFKKKSKPPCQKLCPFYNGRALLCVTVQSFGFALVEFKFLSMCLFGAFVFWGTVQLRAAFGGGCTCEAELGSCCFQCAHSVVDGLLC